MHILTYMTCILNLYRVQDTSLLRQSPSRPGKPHSTQKAKVSARTKQIRSPNSNSIPLSPQPNSLLSYSIYLVLDILKFKFSKVVFLFWAQFVLVSVLFFWSIFFSNASHRQHWAYRSKNGTRLAIACNS